MRCRCQPRAETRRQLKSRELVDRLLSQVEALKSEVRELTEAQQPAHAIAAIEAEQESRRAPPVYWYSDPAALSSEPASASGTELDGKRIGGRIGKHAHCAQCCQEAANVY